MISFQKSIKPNDDILFYPKISEFVTDFHHFFNMGSYVFVWNLFIPQNCMVKAI